MYRRIRQYYGGTFSCIFLKLRFSKLLCTLKTKFFDEVQGKKVSNPVGLRILLPKKFAKKDVSQGNTALPGGG